MAAALCSTPPRFSARSRRLLGRAQAAIGRGRHVEADIPESEMFQGFNLTEIYAAQAVPRTDAGRDPKRNSRACIQSAAIVRSPQAAAFQITVAIGAFLLFRPADGGAVPAAGSADRRR
jgi:hypothetical protein